MRRLPRGLPVGREALLIRCELLTPPLMLLHHRHKQPLQLKRALARHRMRAAELRDKPLLGLAVGALPTAMRAVETA